MSDFILHNDPLEFQNTRQSTKIAFLQQEIRQLQDYIKDLDQMIKINRETLKISLYQTPSTSSSSTVKNRNGNDTTSSTLDPYSGRENPKTLQIIVDQLHEENSKLLQTVERLTKERNVAQSKALISEQICEEAQRHESEAVAELDDKVAELRRVLQDKEFTIQELEKIPPMKEGEGLVLKYREVLPPTDSTMKLHGEVEKANSTLSSVSKEYNKYINEKQELMHINYKLITELNKIRTALLSSPRNQIQTQTKEMKNPLQPSIDPNTSQFGLGNLPDDSDNDLSPAPSPLPEKVEGKTFSPLLKASIPKLDLTKAKKIQEINAKKSTLQPTNQAGNQIDMKLFEKIKLMENELENTKKLLSREILNNKIMSDELANIVRQNVQVASSNDTIIKSNRRYEEKWQKIFYSLEFYKEFYHKYIDLISNKPQPTTKSVIPYPIVTSLDNVRKLKEKFNIELESSPDILIKGLKKIDEENGKNINVSILEADDADQVTDDRIAKELKVEKVKDDNLYELTKDQCKIYLLNLAKDLYVNSNIIKSSIARQVLKNLNAGNEKNGPKNILRLKRSVSNPLDYFHERKKDIFERKIGRVKTKKVNKTSKKHVQKVPIVNQNNDDQFNLSFNDVKPSKRNNKKKYVDADISFNVDVDDFNNKKLHDVSFISNNDIF